MQRNSTKMGNICLLWAYDVHDTLLQKTWWFGCFSGLGSLGCFSGLCGLGCFNGMGGIPGSIGISKDASRRVTIAMGVALYINITPAFCYSS